MYCPGGEVGGPRWVNNFCSVLSKSDWASGGFISLCPVQAEGWSGRVVFAVGLAVGLAVGPGRSGGKRGRGRKKGEHGIIYH